MENAAGSLGEGNGGQVQVTSTTKTTGTTPPGPNETDRTTLPPKRRLQPDGTANRPSDLEPRAEGEPGAADRRRAAATSRGGHSGRQPGEGRRHGGEAGRSGGAAADGGGRSAGAVNEVGGKGAQTAGVGEEESRPPSRSGVSRRRRDVNRGRVGTGTRGKDRRRRRAPVGRSRARSSTRLGGGATYGPPSPERQRGGRNRVWWTSRRPEQGWSRVEEGRWRRRWRRGEETGDAGPGGTRAKIPAEDHRTEGNAAQARTETKLYQSYSNLRGWRGGAGKCVECAAKSKEAPATHPLPSSLLQWTREVKPGSTKIELSS